MPDHMHGVIVIDKSVSASKDLLLKENRFQNIGSQSIQPLLDHLNQQFQENHVKLILYLHGTLDFMIRSFDRPWN